MVQKLSFTANSITLGTGNSRVILGADSGNLVVKDKDANTSTVTPGTGIAGFSGVTVYANSSVLPFSPISAAGSLAFASATSTLYLSNGSGWYKITTVNQTPSITLSTDSVLLGETGNQVDVTYTTTEPEGTPVSVTISNSGIADTNTATFTHTSANTTIRIINTKADQGTWSGTMTATVSDGVNSATDSLTLSVVYSTLVENSESTTFFMAAEGNNQGNYTFTDESDSPHTISDVSSDSNTFVTSFSPYSSAEHSWHFGEGLLGGTEATSDFFMPNNSRLAFGTGDFTIEYWCWADESAISSGTTFDFRGENGTENHAMAAEMFGSGVWYIRLGGVSTTIFSTSGTWEHPRYEWVHYAFVRSSGTLKMYANGTEVASASDTSNHTQTGSGSNSVCAIGRAWKGTNYTNEARWKGYIADFRVVKGTAVYTSAFTPPTEPLTAITNTVLLTCNTPYIAGQVRAAAGSGFTVDHDDYKKIYTVPFSPYPVQAQWDSTKHGGSVSFRSEISVAGHSDFAFGTGNFTVECWYFRKYISSSATNIYDSRHSSDVGIRIYEDSADQKIKVSYGTTSSETVWLAQNTSRNNSTGHEWHHIALVRGSDGYTRLFINGRQEATSTSSVNINNTGGTVNLCDDNNIGILGPIRVIKGTSAYSGNFYPPTENFTKSGSTYLSLKDPANDSSTTVDNSITESHTVFLANWTTAGVRDNTGAIPGLTPMSSAAASGPVSSTAQQKYAVPSILFDKSDLEYFLLHNSNGDKLFLPDERESVTFETWLKWSGTAETQDGLNPRIMVFRQSTQGGSTESSIYADVGNSNRLTMYLGTTVTGGSAVTLVGPNTNILDGNWHHVAIVRNGQHYMSKNNFTAFVDGVAGTAVDYTGKFSSGGYAGIGGSLYITSPSYKETGGWNGYLSQLRLKKESMYPFLPKKQTLTTSTSFQNGVTVTASNCQALACHHATITTNGGNSGTAFTASGDPAVSNFAPLGGMKSVYFDGTGDYLTSNDSDYSATNGTFTMECWFFISSNDGIANRGLFHLKNEDMDGTNDGNGTGFALNTAGSSESNFKLEAMHGDGSFDTGTDLNDLYVFNHWHHVALVRDSSAMKIFLNGTVVATSSNVHNKTSQYLIIGGHQSTSRLFKGYISNFRYIKGQAIYDEDFTVPAAAMYG